MLRNTTQFTAKYSINKAENENKNKNVQTRFVKKERRETVYENVIHMDGVKRRVWCYYLLLYFCIQCTSVISANV